MSVHGSNGQVLSAGVTSMREPETCGRATIRVALSSRSEARAVTVRANGCYAAVLAWVVIRGTG